MYRSVSRGGWQREGEREKQMKEMIIAASYVTVAVTVGVFALYKGVVEPPRERLFRRTHQMILVAAAVLVGVLWALFVPALLARWLRARESVVTGEGRGLRWRRPVSRPPLAGLGRRSGDTVAIPSS
jgi:hypothetical protein